MIVFVINSPYSYFHNLCYYSMVLFYLSKRPEYFFHLLVLSGLPSGRQHQQVVPVRQMASGSLGLDLQRKEEGEIIFSLMLVTCLGKADADEGSCTAVDEQ